MLTMQRKRFERLLNSLTLDQLFNPKFWPRLGFFALVQPESDVLPVRTIYGDGQTNNQTNIGLNPFTSDKSIWLAGPDIVGSILLTGKPPKVLRAIRLEP